MHKAARHIVVSRAKKSNLGKSDAADEELAENANPKLSQQFWEGVEGSMLLTRNDVVRNVETHNANSIAAQTINDTWLFHPNHPYKIAWDVFVMLLVLFSILYVPFRIGFNMQDSPALTAVDIAMDAMFFLDIGITLNTALIDFKTDALQTDRRSVAMKYFRLWFWIDLISSIPIDSIALYLHVKNSSAAAFRLVKVFRLFRLLKLVRIFKLERMNERLERLNINPALVNVMTLLFMLLLVAHVIACFWIFIAGQDVQGDRWQDRVSWVTSSSLQFSDKFDIYVAAMYWTMATILSIGFGDIHAVNTGERIFSVLIMLLGGIMFGAIISQITRLTESRNPTQKLINASLTELDVFLSTKDFPKPLKISVKKAYDYYLQRKSVLVETGGILDDLTHTLSSKLTRLLFEKEISRISLFSRLNNRFVNELVTSSRPFVVDAGSIVLDYGDVCEEVIFLLSGTVRIETKSGKVSVIAGYVNEGGYFGDFEYLTRSVRIARYTAISKCTLLSISDRVLERACRNHYEAGVDFKNELQDRYSVFRTVSRLPPISQQDAFLRKQNKRRRLGRSLALAVTAESVTERVRASQSAAHANNNHGNANEKVEAAFNARPVRTKLWVDGELCTHEKVDVDNHQMMTTATNSGTLYRYMHRTAANKQPEICEAGISYAKSLGFLHPKGHFKGGWDIFVGVLIVYSIISVPIESGFQVNETGSLRGFELFVDILFMIDIVVNMRTLYFDESEEAYVAISGFVMRRYLTSWFLIDFVSSVPFDEILQLTFHSSFDSLKSLRLLKVIRLTRLLKLVRLLKLRRIITAIEEVSGISVVVFDMINMLGQVLLIGHLVACAWWGITTSISPSHGWFDGHEVGADLRYQSTAKQYVASLYQVVTTLTTTGYGDFYASTSEERVVMLFVMCIGASTFGYIVGSVASLVGMLNQANSMKMEKLTAISSFLSEKGCPSELSASIMRHFRHKYAEVSPTDEKLILERLPKSLQVELIMFDNREKMKMIPIFQYIESDSIKAHLFKLLRHEYYDTDQYILREGDTATVIVFLVSGRARVFHQQELRQWRQLQHKKKENLMANRSKFLGIQEVIGIVKESKEAQSRQEQNLVLTGERAVSTSMKLASRLTRASYSAEGSPKGSTAQTTDAVDYTSSKKSPVGVLVHNNSKILNTISSKDATAMLEDLEDNPTNSSLPNQSVTAVDASKKQQPLSNKTQTVMSSISQMIAQEAKEVAESASSLMNNVAESMIGTGIPRRYSVTSTIDIDAVKDNLPHQKRDDAAIIPLARNDSGDSIPEDIEFAHRLPSRKGKSKGKRLLPLNGWMKKVLRRQSSVHGTNKPFHMMTEADLTSGGRTFIMDVYPSEFIGQGAMMKGCELKASARALEPCTAFLLHKLDVEELIERQPGVAVLLQMALGKAMNKCKDMTTARQGKYYRHEFVHEIKTKFADRLSAAAAAKTAAAADRSSEEQKTSGKMLWSTFKRRSVVSKVFATNETSFDNSTTNLHNGIVDISASNMDLSSNNIGSLSLEDSQGDISVREGSSQVQLFGLVSDVNEATSRASEASAAPLFAIKEHEHADNDQQPERHRQSSLSLPPLPAFAVSAFKSNRGTSSSTGNGNNQFGTQLARRASDASSVSAENSETLRKGDSDLESKVDGSDLLKPQTNPRSAASTAAGEGPSITPHQQRMHFLHSKPSDRQSQVDLKLAQYLQQDADVHGHRQRHQHSYHHLHNHPHNHNGHHQHGAHSKDALERIKLQRIAARARMRHTKSCSNMLEVGTTEVQRLGIDLDHSSVTRKNMPYYLVRRRQSFPSVEAMDWMESLQHDVFV